MSIFKKPEVLNPHFVPEILPHREAYIEMIKRILEPLSRGSKPNNIFIYGKTGTGKTCTVKRALEQIDAKNIYLNCRIYSSPYRIMQKIVESLNLIDKSGFGMPYMYEKLKEYLNKESLIVVLDEIDAVKDIDEAIYYLIRINDEAKGNVTIIGISNNLFFKEKLDPRTKSSLYETEKVFPAYTSDQIEDIVEQRVKLSGAKITKGAKSLIAAYTAQEGGDARFALKLLIRAGDFAEQAGKDIIEEEDVKKGRGEVDIDLIKEGIRTLPEHAKIVLSAIVRESETKKALTSGEVYEAYENLCLLYGNKPRSSRWVREYLNLLESFGLIVIKNSGKGTRGQTRFIYPGYDPKGLMKALKEAEK